MQAKLAVSGPALCGTSAASIHIGTPMMASGATGASATAAGSKVASKATGTAVHAA